MGRKGPKDSEQVSEVVLPALDGDLGDGGWDCGVSLGRGPWEW
jgi:hypothetical protein